MHFIIDKNYLFTLINHGFPNFLVTYHEIKVNTIAVHPSNEDNTKRNQF